MGRDGRFGSHGNKTHSGGPRAPVDVRKVPADSVPYGSSISRNGRTVWAAYDANGTLVAVAATAPEARRKYRLWRARRGGDGDPPAPAISPGVRS